MKKFLMVPVIAGMLSLVACGPSAEEKAAKEQAIADSLRQDSTMKADAEAAKQQAAADSIANAEAAKQQAIADSLKQDSIAKADVKGKGKKK